MRFALTEDHRALAEAAREVLTAEAGTDVIRAAWEAPEHGDFPDPVVNAWRRIVDLGVPGVLVPEHAGGLGLDELYLVALMEEVGHSGVPLPALETLCAASVVAESAPERLAGIVSGRALVSWSPRWHGLVPWGHQTDLVLLGGAPETSALGLLSGRLDHDGSETVDRARPVVRYRPGDARAVTELVTTPAAREQLWLRGTLGTAAMLVGLSRRMIEMTSRYVTEREQFGVPVGSFQAVKHQLSTVHIAAEFARPAVLRAAWALTQDANVASGEAARDVSMAKLLANRAAAATARTAIQCHGGMGYTTENDLHLFVKRAWALGVGFGTDRHHRDLVGRTIGTHGRNAHREAQGGREVA